MGIGVFISYNHADLRIAVALQQCLLSVSEKLSVFIDHSGLEGGDEYEEKLAQSIGASQWFLIVSSGPPRPERDMGWCMLEAGQFRAKLLSENQGALIRNRIVSIHDDEQPRQLTKYQGVRISAYDRLNKPLDLRQNSKDTSAFEDTECFRLFQSIIERSTEEPLRNLADSSGRKVLREQARLLIRAFVEAQFDARLPEVVLQPRISFRLPPSIDGKAVVLSDDVKVSGYDSSLRNIFGIADTETTWGDIKRRVQEVGGRSPIWLGEVEGAAAQVARGLVPEQPDGMCISQSDGKFYRVIFARYEPHRNGARRCYVLFILTPTRRFDVRSSTSVLLSALILSIRFRQKILPFIDRIRDASQNEKKEILCNFERDLHQVEAEAREFGLALQEGEDDDAPLMRVIRDGDRKAFMAENSKSWTIGRQAIVKAILPLRAKNMEVPMADAIAVAEKITLQELDKVRRVNGKFIQELTEELLYNEKISLDMSP
jgi:hypothetical protein